MATDDEDDASTPPPVEPFIPDSEGSMHTLPDNVLVTVRLRFDYCKRKYVAEWLLPDRRLDIPAHHDMFKAAEHLVEFTSNRPHMNIGITGYVHMSA